jgi:hypothetical protein
MNGGGTLRPRRLYPARDSRATAAGAEWRQPGKGDRAGQVLAEEFHRFGHALPAWNSEDAMDEKYDPGRGKPGIFKWESKG